MTTSFFTNEPVAPSTSGKKLKVAFYVYPVAFQSPGGGEIQLLKTKQYLEKQGVQIRLFNQWEDRLQDFDLLHTFGSVKDCLNVMRWSKFFGVKNVLSTICWYSWKEAWGTYPDLKNKTLSITRHFAKCFFPFMPSRRKQMMHTSDLLYPNSETEAHQLIRYFHVPRKKIFVVPNGVDPKFADAKPDLFIEQFGISNFVLCVGRFEPRKNQLNMIRAMKGSGIPLVFIGDYVKEYPYYYETCRREADSNTYFLGSFSHNSEVLVSAYAACNTFLLASWLETPGLAALEAALAGAKVVITNQGATQEYFRDFAAYVSPDNVRDIRKKTIHTFESSPDNRLKKHISNHYLWSHVAARSLEGYYQIHESE